MLKLRKPGNWFFVLPLVAFIPWWGMLVTMLICWGIQGHPIYWFMHGDQFPVYISDIGATNLRPLFISCAGWQGLGYVLSIFCEFLMRNGVPRFYMPPWYSKLDRNSLLLSFIAALVGELGLLFCSIFDVAHYRYVHYSMVGVFIVLMFFSVVFLSTAYFSMGKHYALDHPLSATKGTVSYGQLKWYQWRGYIWNKFTLSATFKVVWLVAAVGWAIGFAAPSNESISARFEWLLAFWLGLLFISISLDFYLGGRFKKSRYFRHSLMYTSYYKFDELKKEQTGGNCTL